MRPAFLLLLSTSFLFAWQQIAPATVASPVDQRLTAARQQVEANGKAFQAYNELAFALLRKARDRSDLDLYKKAQAAVDRSLELSPGNYDAVRLRVSALLGQRQFPEALKLAQEINKKGPDDIAIWGLLVDVQSALGNYSEAERDAQWVLDLRPGSALGFEKAAALRELFGDREGATEFWDETLRRTAQSDLDQRAWLLTQKARLTLAGGNAKGASDILAEAFRLFPNSQMASQLMADVQMANGNFAEAAQLREQCYHETPSAANLYQWAVALERAGVKEQAATQFAAFETKARSEIGQPYNSNLELIAFYTERKSDPTEALRIATLESTRRQDSATLAALAWALFQNGKFTDARTQIDKALAVGIRETRYFCHAAQISAKLSDSTGVSKYERELASLGARSCVAGGTLQSVSGAGQ